MISLRTFLTQHASFVPKCLTLIRPLRSSILLKEQKCNWRHKGFYRDKSQDASAVSSYHSAATIGFMSGCEKYMIRRCFTGRPRQIIHRCDLCENVQWAWKHEFRYKHKQTFKTHVAGRIANMLNVGDCLDVYRYNILVEALLSLVDPSRVSWFEGRCYITNQKEAKEAIKKCLRAYQWTWEEVPLSSTLGLRSSCARSSK